MKCVYACLFPTCCAGFVLGKPFWGIPGIEAAPKPTPSKKAAAAAAGLAAADPAEQLLSAEDLANKFVSIPGMDGFFVYQIHYKTVRCGRGTMGTRRLLPCKQSVCRVCRGSCVVN